MAIFINRIVGRGEGEGRVANGTFLSRSDTRLSLSLVFYLSSTTLPCLTLPYLTCFSLFTSAVAALISLLLLLLRKRELPGKRGGCFSLVAVAAAPHKTARVGLGCLIYTASSSRSLCVCVLFTCSPSSPAASSSSSLAADLQFTFFFFFFFLLILDYFFLADPPLTVSVCVCGRVAAAAVGQSVGHYPLLIISCSFSFSHSLHCHPSLLPITTTTTVLQSHFGRRHGQSSSSPSSSSLAGQCLYPEKRVLLFF